MQHPEDCCEDSIMLRAELVRGRSKLNSIFSNSMPRVLESGMSLAAAGPTEGIYHLRSGWACQLHEWSVNRRAIVDVYLPGDIIGLDTLVRTRHPKRVLALTSVIIEATSKRDVLRDVFADRPTALYITWLLGQRQRRADRLLAAMSGLDARGRLAMMLLDFHTRLRRRGLIAGLIYNLPLTYVQIGQHLGLTVVHLSRILRALRDESVVNLEKHCVTILDLAKLTSLARNNGIVSPGADAVDHVLQEAAKLAAPHYVVPSALAYKRGGRGRQVSFQALPSGADGQLSAKTPRPLS